ncbi:hypothetical protein ACRAWD_27235 [Caulobacter segnis]
MRIAYVINSLEGGGAPPRRSAGRRARSIWRKGAEVEVFALLRRDGRGLAAMEATEPEGSHPRRR